MSIYTDLARELLIISDTPQKNYIWFEEDGFRFGLQHKKDYSGKMAKIKPQFIRTAKDKQGFFDILGITDKWRNITHDELLTELLSTTTYEECKSIWRGYFPQDISKDKKHILAVLAILMFEQEINFGPEIWQRLSHYYPPITNPRHIRPRDLLMGYINMVFYYNDVNSVTPYKSFDGLLMPPPRGSIVKQQFFDTLQDDEIAEALMIDPILTEFRTCIFTKETNKYKKMYYESLKRYK